MVLGTAVEGVECSGQEEINLPDFSRSGGCRMFQCAQLGLKFVVGLKNRLQRLAQIGPAVDECLDVVIEFVVNIEKVLQAVVRSLPAIDGLRIGTRFIDRIQAGACEGDIQL